MKRRPVRDENEHLEKTKSQRGATECIYEVSQKEDDMYLSNLKKGAKLKLTSYKQPFLRLEQFILKM